MRALRVISMACALAACAWAGLQIAQLEVRKQRGFWLPVVTFDGGRIAQKSSFPAQSYSYGALRFTVPLFQSGEVEARVAQAKERDQREFGALQASPFFDLWASAGVDEILSALYEKLTVKP